MKNSKIYIGSLVTTAKVIYLDVDLSVKSIKKKVDKLWNDYVLKYDDCTNMYCSELTEKHIVAIVKAFNTHKTVEMHEQLEQYYSMIMSWDENTITEQFAITDEITALIQTEIGGAELSQHILADRSIRYQYKKIPVIGDSLIDIIANRSSVNIWIDNSKYTLISLVEALLELKRTPILITYDIRHQSLNFVDELINVMGPNIVDKIILNSQTIVDTADKIVIVSKFTPRLLDTEWIPKSVISYNSSLRNCKTAIYANKCDLRISYTTTKPLIKTKTY